MKKLYECTSCGFRYYKKIDHKLCPNCKKSTIKNIELGSDFKPVKFDGYGVK